jgi:diguanylate cyclase (GGDEF)-like protein
MSYSRARSLVLLAGLGILLLTAGVMYARRVETVEVLGTLLYIPVLVAFVLWDLKGGVGAGVLAAAAYALLRSPAIDAVGWDRFGGVLISRSIGFIAFGAVGGWASRQLQSSLSKLELYDQIDDATGLYNARFLLQAIDLEVSRSQRYQTLFSLVVVDIPSAVFEPLSSRQRSKVLRDLGRLLGDSVRTVDRAVHASDDSGHHLAVVLPETGDQGANIFAGRLAAKVAEYLKDRGAAVDAKGVGVRQATFPSDDEAPLQAIRADFTAIARHEYPEPAEP